MRNIFLEKVKYMYNKVIFVNTDYYYTDHKRLDVHCDVLDELLVNNENKIRLGFEFFIGRNILNTSQCTSQEPVITLLIFFATFTFLNNYKEIGKSECLVVDIVLVFLLQSIFIVLYREFIIKHSNGAILLVNICVHHFR